MARTCTRCGTEAIAEDAAHCHRCGAPLGVTEASWPGTEDDRAGAGAPAGADWRTAARDAGVGHHEPGSSGSYPPPHGSPALSSDSTNWAMLAHGSALIAAALSVGVFVFVGPLVVWLVKRDEDPFVARHAREALNFNLLMLVLVVVGIAAAVATLGFGLLVIAPVGGIVAIVWLVTTIVGIVKAANGEDYRYPFNVNFVK